METENTNVSESSESEQLENVCGSCEPADLFGWAIEKSRANLHTRACECAIAFVRVRFYFFVSAFDYASAFVRARAIVELPELRSP